MRALALISRGDCPLAKSHSCRAHRIANASAASDEDRAKARNKATAMSANEPWMGMIIERHERIDDLLERARMETTTQKRREALKTLITELSGHPNAEEIIAYPIVSEEDSWLPDVVENISLAQKKLKGRRYA